MEENAVKKCPACGGTMKKLYRRYHDIIGFAIDQRAPELEGKSNLFLELWMCSECSRAGVYVSLPQAHEEKKKVTCPVCGAEYDPGVGCPRCAMNNAMDFRGYVKPAKVKKKERKMPWED